MNEKSQARGIVAQVLSCVLFGFSFMVTKLGTDGFSTFTLLSWRFVLAVVVMRLMRTRGAMKFSLRGKPMRALLFMALLQPVIYFICETYGVILTSSAECGTLSALIPVITLLLSMLILKEHPSMLQKAGILVSVGGVVFISLVKADSASFSLLGYSLVFAAMFSDSLYVIFSHKSTEFSSAEKTYVMAFVGMVVFVLLALVEHAFAGTLLSLALAPFTNLRFLFSVVFLSVGCQVGAFYLSNYAISSLGAARSTSFVGLSTVVSVLLGVLLLGEDFSLLQALGTALVLAGVYLSNREILTG